MTTITLRKPVAWIGSQFDDGFDLARSLWSIYGDRILDRYYDMHELQSHEITPQIQASIDKAKSSPKSKFYNLQ